eukprot:TRINITY_DN12245_c0_g1_i1.p1 TRINITY_DN12245_c0_g1~~TRINITY_DN12245_c0_g1_i1.p1  ORF type:complete len:1428 (+),score=265.27 TRINITY_DN12245_c0_g1_i1:80-4363(+)
MACGGCFTGVFGNSAKSKVNEIESAADGLLRSQKAELQRVKYGEEIGKLLPDPLLPNMRIIEEGYPKKEFNAPKHWEASERVALHLPPAAADSAVAVEFFLNGKHVALRQGQVDPSITLHDLLKHYSRLTGTKKACAQGGCGSCTVTVARWSQTLGKAQYSSANACLLPVGTLHGVSITTTEGLGSCQSGLHPVQQRVADFNGSQCGYCTPGMVMAMYAKIKTLEPSLPTEQDMQLTIDGNICRCTGYMPLLNALKSFGEGGEQATKKVCYSKTGEVEPYMPDQHDPQFPKTLEGHSHQDSTVMHGNGKDWHRPGSLKEVIPLLKQEGMQIVAGNTGLKGLYPDDVAKAAVFVDVSRVEELHLVQVDEAKGMVLGSAVTIETLGALLNMDERGSNASLSLAIQKLKKLPSSARTNLQRMAQHVYHIAGVHVRSRATLGGNMALARSKPEHFPSDLAPQFLAVGTSLNVLHGPSGRTSTVALAEWLKSDACPTELIISLNIPIPNEVFLSQRTMLRPQNCHAYLSAAMCTSVSAANTLQNVRLAFGALPQAMLATKTAAEMEGRSVEDLQKLLPKLSATLRAEAQFTDSHDLQHRETLLNTFLFKFLRSLNEGGSIDTFVSLARPLPTSNDVSFVNNVNGETVAADAIPKHTAGAQASGEIKYAGDVDMGAGGLHAFMVTSPVAHGMLKGVDASVALKMEGVVAYLDHRDIPGDNNVANDDFIEPLFATNRLTFLGQPIGVVVANSSWQAEAAAKAVRVEVDKLPAVMTIEQAIELGNQFVTEEAVPREESKPGVSTGVLETDTPTSVRFGGEWQSGQCKHFYMERQVAMATPRANEFGGGDGVDIAHACQMPSRVQAAVACVLGAPRAWVQLKQHMVGGGFGGKSSRNVPTACAAALAAVRLNRPVKLVQDLCTDMSMNGGRHPVMVRYDARVDKQSGKVLAAKLETFGGQAFVAENPFGGAHKQCLRPWGNYNTPEHTITEGKMCLLNIPPSTAVRGPVHPKMAMAVETILQHAAASTGLPLLAVQKSNMNHKLDNGTQPELWKELEASSNLESRRQEVQAFNEKNKLKKRGISLAPCFWEVPPIPASATVAIYNGGGATAPDGSICITISSAEIGQGLHTKVAQICQLELSKHPLLSEPVPLDLIRVVGNNTEVQGAWDLTGGSGTNPQAMRAVAGACEILVERLKVKMLTNPLKKRLMNMNMKAMRKDGGKKMTWQELIQTVTGPFGMSGADLTARNTVFFGLSNTKSLIPQMLAGKMCTPHPAHGAAVTEVEMDVLTGEHVIIRSDLLYHMPRSVNPVIDLGQIQGAFVQGLGFFLKEETLYSADGSSYVTKDTWEYKPPCVKDIPQQFNVAYFRPGNMKGLVYGSKGVGEPPLFMAVSAVNALRECIMSARKDAGLDQWANVSLPLTPARASIACAVDLLKL